MQKKEGENMPNSMEDISNIPSKNQTLELCEEAVKKEATNIRYVAKRFLSTELCVQAVESDVEAILFIKKEFLNRDVLLAFFKHLGDPNSGKTQELIERLNKRIKKLKGFKWESVIDEELAMELVRINGASIKILPSHLISKEVATIALDTFGNAIGNRAIGKQTKELVLRAIKGGAHQWFIDNELFDDDEILDAFIIQNPEKFHILEEYQKTYERCLLAAQHGVGFGDIPVEYRSKEMFEALITKGNVQISQIPDEFLTKEVKKHLISHSNLNQLYELSSNDIDEELAYLAVCHDYSLGHDCIDEHQSERIVKEALSRSVTQVKYVKPEFLTKELAEKIIPESVDLIKYFPKESLTEELCYLAVSNGVSMTDFDASLQSERIIDKLLKDRRLECPRLRAGSIGALVHSITNEKSERNFDIIRPEFKTQAFYIEAFKQNCNLLTHVSIDILTDDILVPLIQHNWEYIQYIPKECQTANVAMAALEQNPEAINHFEL